MSNEMEKLAAELAGKNAAAEQSKVSAQQQLEDWRQSVTELCINISAWLEPMTENGVLRLDPRNVTLSEAQCGRYEIPSLDLYVGKKVIQLRPKGLFLMGCHGAIDVLGGKPDITLSRHLKDGAEQWLINRRKGRWVSEPLTQDSFAVLLREILT